MKYWERSNIIHYL